MLIAVEGPDGCGKTTFLNQLQKHFKIPIFNCPKLSEGIERNDKIECIQKKIITLFSQDFDFFQDRFLLTCIVYHNIFGDGSLTHKFLELLNEADVLLIYISTTIEQLIKSIKEREKKELPEIILRLPDILKEFDFWCEKIKSMFPEKIIKIDGFQAFDEMFKTLELNTIFFKFHNTP